MTAMPLANIKVLDLTAHRAGPTAARQLADWGADVIKIERPSKDKADAMGTSLHGPDYQNLHRNKRSLTLNLKSEEGRAIFLKMAETADVIVENYRSDVKTRLRIDYENVSAVNSRIVYGSISGFGQSGPDATRPGVDQIAQGMAGLMSITGLPGQGPVRVGIPIADLTSGLLLAQGIMMALFQRERTGEGQWVHTSLLEAQIFMLDFQAARWLMKEDVPQQAGNNHPTGVPTGVFPTSDGHINIAASGDGLWARCCKALDAPQLLETYPKSAMRAKNRDPINAAMSEITQTNTSAHWIAKMNAAGVPCGPINSIDQTFAEPQVQHIGIARSVNHEQLGEFQVVGQPINMSNAPQPATLRQTPNPGAHSEQVLADYGFDRAAVDALRERGVV